MRLTSTELSRLIDDHAAALVMWTSARSHLAEDIVQESFCRLAIQDPPPTHCAAWLYIVCRNLAQNERLRQKRRSIRERASSRDEAIHEPPESSLERQELLETVNAIRPELREVLIARIWGQLGFEEIANICDISTTTAFRRYEAALVELRSRLSPTDRKEHVRIQTE